MNHRRNNIQEIDGKKISMDDIIKYIEQNNKFINKPLVEKFDINDFHVEQKLEALDYKKSCKLEYLPDNLKTIIGSLEFYRIGVISNVNIPSNIDVSYVSSVLTLMVPEFAVFSESDQIEFTETFIRKIHKESKLYFEKLEYSTLGWNVKEFANNVKILKMGKDLMRYIADVLNINIFVIDIENDALVYVGPKTFIKYKKNIFVLRINENKYESVFLLDSNFMDHNSAIINKLTNSPYLVESMDCNFSNKIEDHKFIVGVEDLQKYIDKLPKSKPLDPEHPDVIAIAIATALEPDTKKQLQEQIEVKSIFKEITKKSVGLNGLNGVNMDDYDSESNGFESEHDKNNISNKNNSLHLTNASEENDDQSDQLSDDESDQLSDLGKDSKKIIATSTNTVVQLKDMAKKLGIKLTYVKNGKNISKSKSMLINDINSK